MNKLPAGESNFRQLERSYKRNAKIRNHVWDLTQEQFRKLTKQDCHYCGIPPHSVFDNTSVNKPMNDAYIYSGIDRMDSTLGYFLENCVPACKNCNLAKQRMSYAEFLLWIERVYTYKNLGVKNI